MYLLSPSPPPPRGSAGAIFLQHIRWFKYDRDRLCVNKSQFVPVIFEPPCTNRMVTSSLPYSDPQEEKSMFLRTASIYVQDYTVSRLKSLQAAHQSALWAYSLDRSLSEAAHSASVTNIYISYDNTCIGHNGRPRWLSRYSDSLRVERSGDRIPVKARFSAPVQNVTGVHPVSYTKGTGSFTGVRRPWR
jgi:hypothetical protein